MLKRSINAWQNRVVISLICLTLAALLPAIARAQDTPPSLPHIDIGDQSTYRSYDGTGNNILNPAWGSADTPLLRLFDADYADGFTPSGGDRPSARDISNAVSTQTFNMPSDRGLSSLFWSFGQLLAHDLQCHAQLVGIGPNLDLGIQCATGDLVDLFLDVLGALHLRLLRFPYLVKVGVFAFQAADFLFDQRKPLL